MTNPVNSSSGCSSSGSLQSSEALAQYLFPAGRARPLVFGKTPVLSGDRLAGLAGAGWVGTCEPHSEKPTAALSFAAGGGGGGALGVEIDPKRVKVVLPSVPTVSLAAKAEAWRQWPGLPLSCFTNSWDFLSVNMAPIASDLKKVEKLAVDPKNHDKMRKNLLKALIEHRLGKEAESYINQEELQLELESHEGAICKEASFSLVEAKGSRAQMEDYFERIDNENFTMLILLDGHGGQIVAEEAGKMLKESLPFLEENIDSFKPAIELVFNKIQERFQTRLHDTGSTALCCLIQKATGNVFTATLGDSEAIIYREIEGVCKAIPLSCVRNWHSPKDINRFAKSNIMSPWFHLEISQMPKEEQAAYEEKKVSEIVERLLKKDPKEIRTPSLGLNVARSFGDAKDSRFISSKPKVTGPFKLVAGDSLVLACDGLLDEVKKSAIIHEIASKGDPKTLANRLLELVPGKASDALDNVTIACLGF